ncbi:aldo/keto reductase [Kribbella sp. NBC_01505]|uniref:aldo/keto reductase n=1 Tax=Kribbella sp. NBC_01505 TaxID=2903580 RepID=UPI003868E7CB
MSTTLDTYRLLGRSGLRVSPLSLGTMTFGEDWGWGTDKAEAQRILDTYADRGGNFVDTASMYTNGTSEQLLGQLTQDRRDQFVLATKYTMITNPTDPNAGGNHRKSMVRSVERSLRNLQTDYIDLLYLHAWDFTTPVEEILRAMDDLVRQGKVLYVGISDAPAWQVSRMQAIADLRGWSPLVALQVEYSLVERTVERDLIPMARELGLGVLPWSPLASGVLTGKYTRADLDHDGGTAGAAGTRKNVAASGNALTERALDIADVVKVVAERNGWTPAQVALAWTLQNPGVTSPIIGARTLNQFEQNLTALDVEFSAQDLAELEAVSAIELGFPHEMLSRPMTQSVTRAGLKIESAPVPR